jgi:hypothetical protein
VGLEERNTLYGGQQALRAIKIRGGGGIRLASSRKPSQNKLTYREPIVVLCARHTDCQICVLLVGRLGRCACIFTRRGTLSRCRFQPDFFGSPTTLLKTRPELFQPRPWQVTNIKVHSVCLSSHPSPTRYPPTKNSVGPCLARPCCKPSPVATAGAVGCAVLSNSQIFFPHLNKQVPLGRLPTLPTLPATHHCCLQQITTLALYFLPVASCTTRHFTRSLSNQIGRRSRGR